MRLFADDGHLAVRTQADDAAGRVRLVLLTTRPADIVDRLDDARVDVAVVLGGRLAADVRRRGDQRTLEPVAQLAREGLGGDAQGYRTVVGYQVRSQVDGTVQNEGRRLGATVLQTVYQLPRHVRHLAHIALQAGIAVHQADERLRVVALLDVIHPAHGLGVRRVAAQPMPHTVSVG